MTQSNTYNQNGKHCDDDHDDKRSQKKYAKKEIKPPKKISESYLHNSGLYYLQRFATSSGNFKRVMGRKIDKSCRFHKDQDRDECMKMLDDLTVKFLETGLLDDEGYCRAMVTSLRRRGLSTRAIHAKLKTKALDTPLIKSTLHDYDHQYGEEEGQNAELRAAITCARKKRLLPFNPDKEVDKSLGCLARAGFSYGIAQKVISMDVAEAQEVIASYL
jgi:regulatory protein